MTALTAGIVGGSGYIGGELVRLLLGHPRLTLTQVSSQRLAGRRVDGSHPNLRGLTKLRFCPADEIQPCDVLFFAVPHGEAMTVVPRLASRAGCRIDLSADFRLSAADYPQWYATAHTGPEALSRFVPGLPELYRSELRTADDISVPGCMATAAILALLPMAAAGVVDAPVFVDARTGSSGSGRADAGESGRHAQRAGAMRVFAPSGHRHEVEIRRHTGLTVRMTATATPAVRGVQVLCHVQPRTAWTEPSLRQAYRRRYVDEPFVRIVAEHRGVHRLPDPKTLLGSNFCDVGFAAGPDGRISVIAALDNLVKGGAGNAVQCLNVRMGWPERLGLEFPGLHPL